MCRSRVQGQVVEKDQERIQERGRWVIAMMIWVGTSFAKAPEIFGEAGGRTRENHSKTTLVTDEKDVRDRHLTEPRVRQVTCLISTKETS